MQPRTGATEFLDRQDVALAAVENILRQIKQRLDLCLNFMREKIKDVGEISPTGLDLLTFFFYFQKVVS